MNIMSLIRKKSYLSLITVVSFALIFTACSDDSTGPNGGDEESQLESYTGEDIAAAEGITYYSLRENTTIDAADSASTEWDIAFSGTTIYTNSAASGPGNAGAVILDQSFD